MPTDRKNLSSEQIKKNFKNIRTEKYIHIKVLTILSVLLIGYLLYFVFSDKGVVPKPDGEPGKKTNEEIAINRVDSTLVDSTKVVSNVRIKKIIPINIYASSINDLRDKIRNISSKYLLSGEYTPQDLSLRISSNSFSCKFVEDSSQFVKLSLVWGPKSTGCESCANVIAKNPGSRTLLHKEDAQFIYEVIAISK